jgi:hypothetical protein
MKIVGAVLFPARDLAIRETLPYRGGDLPSQLPGRSVRAPRRSLANPQPAGRATEPKAVIAIHQDENAPIFILPALTAAVRRAKGA